MLKYILAFALFIMIGSSACRVAWVEGSRPVQHDKQEMRALSVALSQRLNISLDPDRDHLGVYAFVADWLRVPYRYGSFTQQGTDCSGFVYTLYREVYKISIERTSAARLQLLADKIDYRDLQEGDLVFFNISNRKDDAASHVGIYLKNGLFAHASTKQGVVISHLHEPYYARTFVGGGRLLQP